MHTFKQMGLVALGSVLGSLARWGLTLAASLILDLPFPWGTLFINITGCLFLGWFVTLFSKGMVIKKSGWLRRDDLWLLVAVGFTGGYTTFSTFEYEALALLDRGDGFLGMTYLFGSVVLGLLGVRCGRLLARMR